MLTRTKAIVLHALKYGDDKLIVDLLTELYGRLSFVQHIPKTAKAKVKKQYFQPLTLVEIEFDYRQNARLLRIRDIRISHPYASIPFDATKLSIALFVAEFLDVSTRGERQGGLLYQYVESSLEWLDACHGQFANFHLVFMMRLSRFIGFFPNLNDYAEGDYFDLRNACFTPKTPSHRDYVRPSEAARIITLIRMNYESMHLFKMSHDDRNRITDVAIQYYRLHVPDFHEIKSLDVLRELF